MTDTLSPVDPLLTTAAVPVTTPVTAVVVTRGLLVLICKLGINNRSAYTR